MSYFSEHSRQITKHFTVRSLFKKIIGGSKSHVPENIQATLFNVFPGAASIEWSSKENFFESLFYSENREYIAKFAYNGDLLEYRINEPLDNMPDALKAAAEEHGEVMNCISIHSGEQDIIYEIIVRDAQLIRYMLMMKPDGSFVSKLKL